MVHCAVHICHGKLKISGDDEFQATKSAIPMLGIIFAVHKTVLFPMYFVI